MTVGCVVVTVLRWLSSTSEDVSDDEPEDESEEESDDGVFVSLCKFSRPTPLLLHSCEVVKIAAEGILVAIEDDDDDDDDLVLVVVTCFCLRDLLPLSPSSDEESDEP
jgi:hypothetical protein